MTVKPRTHLILDTVILLFFVVTLVSGLLLWSAYPSGSGQRLGARSGEQRRNYRRFRSAGPGTPYYARDTRLGRGDHGRAGARPPAVPLEVDCLPGAAPATQPTLQANAARSLSRNVRQARFPSCGVDRNRNCQQSLPSCATVWYRKARKRGRANESHNPDC